MTTEGSVYEGVVAEAVDEFPKRTHTREAKPNPLDEHVKQALANEGQAFVIRTDKGEDAVKTIENDLRRGAAAQGGRVEIVKRPDGGVTAIFYRAFHGKSGRTRTTNYTSADVRVWAAENGLEAPEGKRIPAEVRSAYREAHGLN